MKLILDEKERSALSKSEKSIIVEPIKHGEVIITGQKGNQYVPQNTSRILPKNNEIDASKIFNDSKMIMEDDENKSRSSLEKSKLFIENQIKSGKYICNLFIFKLFLIESFLIRNKSSSIVQRTKKKRFS